MIGLIRVVHPAPTVAVVTLSAALGAIVSAQAGGEVLSGRLVLTTLAVLGSQVVTGALNDWVDRDRDRMAQPSKPIPAGQITPRGALRLAAVGAALQLAASVPLGPAPTLLGAVASASAVAYNLWLSRTPFSIVPYLVSFGVLPLWVASGVGVNLDRVAAAPLLVGPFAAAAHLANAVRDFDVDRRLGSRNLAQTLGRTGALAIGWSLAMVVGIAVGTVFVIGGRTGGIGLGLGVAGLVAVAQGVAGPNRLWGGMLVAAVCWTVAWALATG